MQRLSEEQLKALAGPEISHSRAGDLVHGFKKDRRLGRSVVVVWYTAGQTTATGTIWWRWMRERG
jgi:hypothetical protein